MMKPIYMFENDGQNNSSETWNLSFAVQKSFFLYYIAYASRFNAHTCTSLKINASRRRHDLVDGERRVFCLPPALFKFYYFICPTSDANQDRFASFYWHGHDTTKKPRANLYANRVVALSNQISSHYTIFNLIRSKILFCPPDCKWLWRGAEEDKKNNNSSRRTRD